MCGLDVTYHGGEGRQGELAVACAVVVDTYSGLDEAVASSHAVGVARFPYVPGWLAFREAPLLLEALDRLEVQPDVLLCDGHGYAHDRRFGLPSFMAAMSQIPSVGVAKSVHVGSYDARLLGQARGSSTPLVDGGEEVGVALRTQTDVRPVFVSTADGTATHTAAQLVLRQSLRHRVPEVVRLADIESRRLLRTTLREVKGES